MHYECNNGIVMIEVWLTEVDISCVNDWIEITIFIQNKVSLKIEFEVLKNQLYIANVRNKPEVNILHGINLPMFDSWELNIDQWLVHLSW